MIALGETPQDYNKHFVLTADIDLDPNLPGHKVFDKAIIAPDTDSADQHRGFFYGVLFTGTLDGKGHKVSRLTITGRDYLGLFGGLGATATVSNLGLEAVQVSGIADRVGSLVGQNDGSITSCYGSGSVNGRMDVGGLVGLNRGSIIASYSISQVGGISSHAGGLVGYNSGSITLSHSSGMVSGSWSVGGLVGLSVGCISACYSTGSVSGERPVGGLVGGNRGSITTCYGTGSVRGIGLWVGGLAGENNYGTITASFWDIETSGQTTSAGGTGKTTTEMQRASTFFDADWDFVGETANGAEDIWWILEGKDYPRLWWEAPAIDDR